MSEVGKIIVPISSTGANKIVLGLVEVIFCLSLRLIYGRLGTGEDKPLLFSKLVPLVLPVFHLLVMPFPPLCHSLGLPLPPFPSLQKTRLT